ncbi:MAG: signal peptidase I, partial [Treponema porcinum]|nr:signal peptidase I [Treponema porcinum]
HDDKIVVKRCVAVGGAQLDFSDDTEYTLSVNGKKIVLTESQFRRMAQFTSVPEGYALVLGDNYSESLDSRSYGFVSTENIIGKVIIR